MNRPTIVFGANYGPDVDPRRWVVIYPPYIDKNRKEKEGRKIAKEKCVEKPNMKEVFDCATLLRLQTALELDKAYCRDYWQRGRIRVRLFDDDGKPIRPDIANRRTLYSKVAELIPEHRRQVESKKAKSAKKPAAKQGKGAPAPTKKKKKGKR
ncbi:Signal recognition particle 19 kDa protein [Gracilariopsis chorda]|uniref:Signal recognition particle 19 kDa protein n=1 Tax=Gracilariopsis chorda TaxID=448386 RepID=A0A2V3J346_9FLOR|nr:Signal recognition particle 19 kDa protein [Gracilariopsis chorda]|eukprot:PXF48804.1 Signal recognition particle 19 kDa protein [Gracilariopsis chorda]